MTSVSSLSMMCATLFKTLLLAYNDIQFMTFYCLLSLIISTRSLSVLNRYLSIIIAINRRLYPIVIIRWKFSTNKTVILDAPVFREMKYLIITELSFLSRYKTPNYLQINWAYPSHSLLYVIDVIEYTKYNQFCMILWVNNSPQT